MVEAGTVDKRRQTGHAGHSARTSSESVVDVFGVAVRCKCECKCKWELKCRFCCQLMVECITRWVDTPSVSPPHSIVRCEEYRNIGWAANKEKMGKTLAPFVSSPCVNTGCVINIIVGCVINIIVIVLTSCNFEQDENESKGMIFSF